jgi:hypothetical protein
MKALEVCRHHDPGRDGASERHQKMPRLGLGACRGIYGIGCW